ncbi:MAG: hypothetical protein MHPSP_004064, partial [Paramarteilia canceri]
MDSSSCSNKSCCGTAETSEYSLLYGDMEFEHLEDLRKKMKKVAIPAELRKYQKQNYENLGESLK